MSAAKRYGDMSHDEQLAWGAAEAVARIADLEVRSSEGLKRAQRNAEARRRLIGATRGQATSMVILALRAKRVAQWHSEQGKA